MTHGLEFTRPIMRRAAGLNDGLGSICEKNSCIFERCQLPRNGGADITDKRVDLKFLARSTPILINFCTDGLLSLWRSCDHVLAL